MNGITSVDLPSQQQGQSDTLVGELEARPKTEGSSFCLLPLLRLPAFSAALLVVIKMIAGAIGKCTVLRNRKAGAKWSLLICTKETPNAQTSQLGRFACPLALGVRYTVGTGPQAGIERFRTAFNKQDAAGVASLFQGDGKILPPGRPMITGAEGIRAYWQAAFTNGVSNISKKPIDIIVSGDLAVETSSYIVVFKDQQIVGKDTLVWRRGPNNVWSIVSDIWNNDK